MHVHEELCAPSVRERTRAAKHPLDGETQVCRALALGRRDVLTPTRLLYLQRLVGNAAVTTFLRPHKMVVSAQLHGADTETPQERAGAEADVRTVGTDAGRAAASASPAGCTPRQLSRREFLQQAGTSVSEFGLTTLNVSQVTFPEVRLDARRRLQPTVAILPTVSSICIGPGVFLDPQDTIQVVGQEGSGCPTGRYPRRWNITGDGADKIRAGEQEHCDDFQFAFDSTLRRFMEAVNQLAASNRRFTDDAAAKRSLQRIVGVSPDNWQMAFTCLAGKTRERDSARNGWHTPRPRHLDPYPHCRHVEMIVDANSLRQVGAHPSNSIIRGCGEGQAPSHAGRH